MQKVDSIFSLTNHELYVVTASAHGRENGMLASWVLPGTLAPDRPRAVVLLSVSNFTTELIEGSGRFALQMLAEGQHDLVPHFGLESGRDKDKLEGLQLDRSPSGLPLIQGTCGWAECRTLTDIDAGDRAVTLVEIEKQQVHADRTPLRTHEAFARLDPAVIKALLAKRRRDGLRDATLLSDFGRA